MRRFDLGNKWQADCVVSDTTRIGEIFHVARNESGGANLTPIARYFAWRPAFFEGFNPHWRVDCFVRRHELSPEPMQLGQSLVEALVRERLCERPIWMSAHTSSELEGKAYGDLFEEE